MARQDRYEVLDGPSEYPLCRAQLCVWIRCVSILEDGALQGVGVKAAVEGGVVSDDPFDGLYTNLRPAIWRCHAPLVRFNRIG